MAKKTVFITRSDFPPIMYELLKEKFELVCWNENERLSKSRLIENIKGKFGIICSPRSAVIDRDVILAAGNNLKVVSTCSVGLEHLDVKELKSRGIRIGFTANVTTEAVAEHAIGLLLATSRRIVETHNSVLRGEWRPASLDIPHKCTHHGLHLSTVGIVGCGRIGASVLKKLKSFEPRRILYYSRKEKIEANKCDGERKPLDYLIRESDFIVLSLSLCDGTRQIINKDTFNSMKSNAIFVNVGRGGLVDEVALIEALKNKRIAGAGLDVFTQEPLPIDSPLLKLNNVVITSHKAYFTHEAANSAAEISAKNILAVLNNEIMPAEL